MLSSSFSIDYLFNNIIKRINQNQFFVQKLCFARYKTQVNIAQSSNEINAAIENIEANKNEKEKSFGLFKHFSISQPTQTRLKDRGIEYLYPVQYRSFNEITSGKDCIVQSRTGTGKTLAFSLPIVERFQNEINDKKGRYPRCLILEPTRELAKQVTNDFLSIKSRLISISTIYGGKDYAQQEYSLKKGSDIVIGTPGRIKDFIEKKILILNQCQIIVLDEVDRMLDMGFQDDVDFIIKNVSKTDKKIQMIVFSATIPIWLKKTLPKYLSKTNSSFINLIDDQKEKTSLNVQHFLFKINNSDQISNIICKILSKYSNENKIIQSQGQVIIFCQTKKECDLLSKSKSFLSLSSDVLHGDLSQKKREQVLYNFRQGRIRILITTDVSARGLDIPQVDLVIITSPPQNWESYVHRSGRTGRAGKEGKTVTIYNHQQTKLLKNIQTNAKIEFHHIDRQSLGYSSETTVYNKQNKIVDQVNK